MRIFLSMADRYFKKKQKKHLLIPLVIRKLVLALPASQTLRPACIAPVFCYIRLLRLAQILDAGFAKFQLLNHSGYIILFLGLAPVVFAERIQPLPIGNFSVPAVTQIGPLVGFGQLLIGKEALLVQLGGAYTRGHKSAFNEIAPSVTYGIRDDLALFLAVPWNLSSRTCTSHSSGIADMIVQGEYGYYQEIHDTFTLQGSVVANVQFPTGSSSKNPPTGNGSFTYFLGTTFAYLSQNWYAFVSPGANITTPHHGTQFGNSYLYQAGIARYIKRFSPTGWVFDVMVEWDGTYVEKNKVRGKRQRNSGGNSIFMTPSLWLSSSRWIFQWGVGFPLVQHLNGKQDKMRYFVAYNLGIAFQF